MTKLEMAAVALINELENNLKRSNAISIQTINALNEARKVLEAEEAAEAKALDDMYSRHIESEKIRVATILKIPNSVPENILNFPKKI